MNPAWFRRPDWPSEWELKMRAKLMEAIEELPGERNMTNEEIETNALALSEHYDFARELAQSWNRPASQQASEREMRKLANLLEKLSDHVKTMHEPAVRALASEGYYVSQFADQLSQMKEGVRVSFGNIESGLVQGRKPEILASEVSDIAGSIFDHITGKRPTLTTNAITGEVSGLWPDFLRKVFDALRIEASVAAQARVVSEKMRTKTNH